MASSARKRRLVSSLEGEVLERLSMKLNPRMLLKDYQSLAGRLKYTCEFIRNFARERDPTLALLQHWWSSSRGKEKTVTVLIEHLSDMERDDCVDLLRPYEFCNSHEASELDERPVIAGAIDMNINPYNPYFPARDNHQAKANQYGVTKSDQSPALFNEYQAFPSGRESENIQRNASPYGMNVLQFEPQRAAPGMNMHGQYFSFNQDPISHKMLNMKLDRTNSFPDNQPGMIPSTSTSFPNGNYPSSVSSSMDSLQFEKHFTGYENAPPQPLTNTAYQGNDFPRYDRENNIRFPPASPDGFYGARRDLRLHGAQGRPHPLDGSSLSSSEAGVRRFVPSPRDDRMVGSNRYYGQYARTVMDPNGWQRDYMGYESTLSPESHSVTVAGDKVALVIGNQDYHHEKLRGLLYPEKDARDVADVLGSLNFKVISLVNLTLREMRTAMLAFCCLLGKGVYGVVYYAGHGYEDNGENFLLPVDSDLKYNREHSLRTQEIIEEMQQCGTSLNLLIIDTCRVSLPNKSGTNVPRIKRNAKGNNICAFSCCSQQESLEKKNCQNGMYCTHLLRRLKENRRVEHILMDVATDFVRAYDLPQRPCLETDTLADFRLTDPIQPDLMDKEYAERCRRWAEAKRHPHEFSVGAGSLKISLDFEAKFSNVLSVFVVTGKISEKSIKEFHLKLYTVAPLSCVRRACEDIKDGAVICRQTFEIQNIQKHIKLQGTVLLTINAMFKEDGKLCHFEKEIDLGWPLVSSITCLWDCWLLGDRCKSTAV